MKITLLGQSDQRLGNKVGVHLLPESKLSDGGSRSSLSVFVYSKTMVRQLAVLTTTSISRCRGKHEGKPVLLSHTFLRTHKGGEHVPPFHYPHAGLHTRHKHPLHARYAGSAIIVATASIKL